MIQTNHTYVNRVGINTIGVNSVNASLSRKRDNSLVDCWFFKNKTNSDADRGKVVGLKGNVLTLNGFSFNKLSGYGGFNINFNEWYINPVATGRTTDSIVDITNTTKGAKVLETTISQIPSFKIKVSGLLTGQSLMYDVSLSKSDGVIINDLLSITKDGIYTLPAFSKEEQYIISYIGFRPNFSGDCNLRIEQVPLYPDSLVFDGIDDWAQVVGGNIWGKCIIMRCIPLKSTTVFYDQRNNPANNFVAIFNQEQEIAYQGKNLGGSTYIDGELNTTKKGIDLINIDQIITVTNDGVDENNSKNFVLGVNDAKTLFSQMAISYLAIYKEVLTPEQIKIEIDKLEGDLVEPYARYDIEEQGATNEIMRLNPVLRNLQGNSDYDIQLKNFDWALKSGVGGYGTNFRNIALWVVDSTGIEVVSRIDSKITIYYKQKYLNQFRYATTPTNNQSLMLKAKTDIEGRWRIQYKKLDGSIEDHYTPVGKEVDITLEPFDTNVYSQRWVFFNPTDLTSLEYLTITQIPENKYGLYGDGIDDYGICSDMMPDDFTLMAETILLNGDRDTNGLFCTNYPVPNTVYGWNLQQYGANTVRIGNTVYRNYSLSSTILNTNVVSSFTKDSTVITCRVNNDIFTLGEVYALSGKDFYLFASQPPIPNSPSSSIARFGEMILFRLAIFRPLTNYELKRAKEKYFKTEE